MYSPGILFAIQGGRDVEADRDGAQGRLPLSHVTFHLLLALAEGPGHGYGLARAVEEATGGALTLGPGTLYGSLSRLEDEGLIEETDTPPDAEGRHAERRKYYRLTPEGRDLLRAETRRLTRLVELARERVTPGAPGEKGR